MTFRIAHMIYFLTRVNGYSVRVWGSAKHLSIRKSTVDGRNLEQNTREYRVSCAMLVHMTTTEMNLRDPRS